MRSLRVGQVTLPISMRTSRRNLHEALLLGRLAALPPAGLLLRLAARGLGGRALAPPPCACAGLPSACPCPACPCLLFDSLRHSTAPMIIGRAGGTRTPDPRFWRPVLYQLSYSPTEHTRRDALARLLVHSVRPAPATVLLELDAVRVVLLVLVRVVVATLALLASERDELTHVVILSTEARKDTKRSAGGSTRLPAAPARGCQAAPATAAQYSRPRRAGKTRRRPPRSCARDPSRRRALVEASEIPIPAVLPGRLEAARKERHRRRTRRPSAAGRGRGRAATARRARRGRRTGGRRRARRRRRRRAGSPTRRRRRRRRPAAGDSAGPAAAGGGPARPAPPPAAGPAGRPAPGCARRPASRSHLPDAPAGAGRSRRRPRGRLRPRGAALRGRARPGTSTSVGDGDRRQRRRPRRRLARPLRLAGAWPPGSSRCASPAASSRSGASGARTRPSSGPSRWRSSPSTWSASSTTSSCTPSSRTSSASSRAPAPASSLFVLLAVVMAPLFEEIVLPRLPLPGLRQLVGLGVGRAASRRPSSASRTCSSTSSCRCSPWGSPWPGSTSAPARCGRASPCTPCSTRSRCSPGRSRADRRRPARGRGAAPGAAQREQASACAARGSGSRRPSGSAASASSRMRPMRPASSWKICASTSCSHSLHDALAVVDDEVDARVAGADVAGQPHLRAEALTDDVAERLQEADLGRRLEARPLGHHVGAAREERGARARGAARRPRSASRPPRTPASRMISRWSPTTTP